MSTNYFNVPTYRPSTRITPAGADISIPDMPSQPSNLDPSVAGAANAPGYAQRNLLLGQLGTGGSISTRYKGLMQARRDAAKSQLRRYGGISFREDDTSTVKDESLTPEYESDKMGDAERDAYNASLSRGAASGISSSIAGDQLVGAALQRVSEEASKIIMQYAGDINGMATQQLSESNEALMNYMSLYGSDAQWLLAQKEAAAPPPVDPKTSPPDQIVRSGGTVPRDNSFVSGRTVYSGSQRPNVQSYRNRFSAALGYRVEARRVGNKWTVVVTYSPSTPGGAYRTAANVGVNAGSSWDVSGASTF